MPCIEIFISWRDLLSSTVHVQMNKFWYTLEDAQSVVLCFGKFLLVAVIG